MKLKHKLVYMKCAEAFAECSNATRLKVGAVLVKNNRIISCGYNGLMKHVDGELEDENNNTKPDVLHAEENALLALIRSNENSTGSIMFITHNPCILCSNLIIDSGVTKVYYRNLYRDTSGIEYLCKHGVAVEQLGDKHEHL